MDAVTSLVVDKPVVIFSKSICDMSHSIQALIKRFGANPTVYELDQMPNGQKIDRSLRRLGCQPSVPVVFIGQQFVGGDRQVMTLLFQNPLGLLHQRAGAIWVWPST